MNKYLIQDSQKDSKEASAIRLHCLMSDDIFIVGEAKEFKKHIPYGDVRFVEEIIGDHVEPNYFPDFLFETDAVKRHIWATKMPEKGFVKPLFRYKTFTGYLWDGSEETKPTGGPFLMSREETFYDEWRYYVTKGQIVLSGWYSGDEVNTPEPPEFPWSIEKNWSGTIDVGMTSDGLQVVECHHPFACGFYGKLNTQDSSAFAKWIADGWEYINA